jgi:hypothetical protein
VAASLDSVETSVESGFLNVDRSSQRGAFFRNRKARGPSCCRP